VKVRPVAQNPRSQWTIRDLGQEWTSNKLAAEFPDQIRSRRATDKDVSRLDRHIYPKIGDVRVSALTLADVERVMASLKRAPTKTRKEQPQKLSASTRRHVALILNRLLNLAVYPLRLRESNPIPKGLVPQVGKRKAMAYLYPDEDRALLACKPIPLRERALWGFLVREGCRVSEALGLRWSDLDLTRGTVRLDRNKTDDPRAWALAPGVAAALATFEGDPGELVFEPPADPLDMAEVLRARLKQAGVERMELHNATAERIALRVHDLRGSFVTVALANGRSESWVSDRTGHRSSQMLARYKRAARTADELKLGDWTPLDVALGLAKPKPANDTGGGGNGPRITRLPRTPRAARRDRSRDRVARPKGLEPLTGGLETQSRLALLPKLRANGRPLPTRSREGIPVWGNLGLSTWSRSP
jgi:integrase